MRRRDPYEAYAFSAVDARASQADCWLFKADDVGVQFLSLSAPRVELHPNRRRRQLSI